MAGYRESLAVEWDDNAVETLRLNFPDVPIYHGDIGKLTVDECLDLAGLKTRAASTSSTVRHLAKASRCRDDEILTTPGTNSFASTFAYSASTSRSSWKTCRAWSEDE